MEMEKISSSLEDYLEAIAEIIEDNGHAHTKDIADKLHVKMPSVTSALQTLSANGLIRYQSHAPVVSLHLASCDTGSLADPVCPKSVRLFAAASDLAGIASGGSSALSCVGNDSAPRPCAQKRREGGILTHRHHIYCSISYNRERR